ncbi:MAG: hypothetical protein JXB07_07260 [Anaerolineae bacterium]|nr:hypothetical protein [Anaerolineae bacterium]
MTEFLSNLVSRSMNRAADARAGEILRPRLPALFEVPARAEDMAMPRADESIVPGEVGVDLPSQGLATSDDASFAAEETPSGLFNHTEPFPLAAERETPVHRRLKDNRRDEDSTQADEYASDEDEERAQPEGIPNFRRSILGDYRHIQPEQGADQARPQPAGLSAGRREKAHLVAALQSEGAGAERGISGWRLGQKGTTGAKQAIRPRIDRYQGAAEKPSMTVIAPLRTGENGQPVADRYDQSAEEVQTPTVHINIGRIEVRAITQPPPQPMVKPVRQQPKLGLDDYLRQRNEGKR